jgi:hypothetical protein
MINRITGSNNPVEVSSMREWMGNAHFMSQLNRHYDFPIEVYRESEDGSRALVRVEYSAA